MVTAYRWVFVHLLAMSDDYFLDLVGDASG